MWSLKKQLFLKCENQVVCGKDDIKKRERDIWKGMKYVHCLKGTSKKREQRIWKHTCRGMAGEKEEAWWYMMEMAQMADGSRCDDPDGEKNAKSIL